jgi:8-oxo-dGTP diphosphatase
MDFRVATKSFIIDNGKLLIVKRNSDNIQRPNMWELPGGRLDPGEDPHKGAKREIMEETGIEIEILHPINIRHFTRKDNQKITLIIFLCKALHNNITLSQEHTDFDWIHLNNCKEKLDEFFHPEVDIFNKLELHKLF